MTVKSLQLVLPAVGFAALAAFTAGGTALAQDSQMFRNDRSLRQPLYVQVQQFQRATEGCPDGWVPSSQPGGCQPGSLTIQPVGPVETGLPPGSCPEGFSPAVSPLNPQLGCLPDNLAAPSQPDYSRYNPAQDEATAVLHPANSSHRQMQFIEPVPGIR